MRKKLVLSLLLTLTVTGCNTFSANETTGSARISEASSALQTEYDTTPVPSENSESAESTKASGETTVNTTSQQTVIETTSTENEQAELFQQVKEYILQGQEDVPASGQLKWSDAFLNQVPMEAVYQSFLKEKGEADDVKDFAIYLTAHAPIPENWQELFAADLLRTYDQIPTRYELLEGDLYQVYVKMEDKEVPFVVVSSRTGYFHG